MSQPPSSGGATPKPAVAAFFRSTTWKFLILADVVAVGLGVAIYYFTKNILAFAPLALVGGLMVSSILRVARPPGGTAPAGDDPIVK